MNIYLILLAVAVGASNAAVRRGSTRKDDSLVMVHVLFRHGQRTPDVSTIYPFDPYRNESYYPYGLGALTNEGKRTEYNIGKALRERYTDFLGIYTPGKIHVQTSPFSRTKISAQLVSASLFPPVGIEKWHRDLNWQPIDYSYNPRDEDMLFLHGVNCQKYLDLSNQQFDIAIKNGDFGNFDDVAEYLTYHTGYTFVDPERAFNVYSALMTEQEWGFDLPEWSEVVYPEPLQDIALKYLDESVKTDMLKTLSGGFLLQRMADETSEKLNGSDTMKERKISLYSGHDFTIVALLGALGVFEAHHPTYGAYIILEVHKVGNTHGIKVFYQNYKTRLPQLLRLPGCEATCPFYKFREMYSKYFPTVDMCKTKE